MRRTLYWALLLFILLASFTTFRVHSLPIPSYAEPSISNMAERTSVGTLEKPIVEKHRITSAELERLKQSIGAWQANRGYNQSIYDKGTGLRPPTDDEWAAIMSNSFMVENVSVGSVIQATSSVDLTTTPWFPPIGNQSGQSSCVAWAVGYYTKTFQEAREHNWNLSGAPADKIMSPSFIYNLINYGENIGTSYYDAIQLVCTVGACSLARMPYNASDCTSWPSEQAWEEAMLYRGGESSYCYMDLQNDTDLINLKNWIASKNLAILGVDAGKIRDPVGGTSRLDGNDMLTLDNYVPLGPNHAGTIVGYNDNFAYTEEGQTHYGAFKIANSWGIGGWENVYDGCYWISYEAMKQRVQSCMFYGDRIDYKPELIASFEMNHTKRDECGITVGIGDANTPIVTKSFNSYIHGGSLPFSPNKILFDITEFRDIVDIDAQQCFLSVIDLGSPTTGTILCFTINNGVSADLRLATINYQYVYANLTLHLRLNVPGDFPTIQMGINAAYTRGNTISVAPGTYYENIVLNKSISLIGADMNTTIIDGNFTENVINITAPDVSVNGFTVQKGINAGVYVVSTGSILSGNIIINNGYGLILNCSSYNNISRNNIATNSFFGLYSADSSGNSIYHNNFLFNSQQACSNSSANLWDHDYPSGGNYWSDYAGVDDIKRGRYQNETGSDGVGDFSYVVGSDEHLSAIDRYPLMKPYTGHHDVGISRINAPRTVIGQVFMVNISVTILNYGINTEIFNVTAYANTTVLAKFIRVTLEGRNSTDLLFAWDTNSSEKGTCPNFRVMVDTVPGETDSTDNTEAFYSAVFITMPGDVDGDRIVDVFDAILLAGHYGEQQPWLHPAMDANVDIDGNGIIDINDRVLFTMHFGEYLP